MIFAVKNSLRTFSRAPKLQKTHKSIITTNTQRFTWKPKRKKSWEIGRFYFNPEELQVEINDSVITGAIGFL